MSFLKKLFGGAASAPEAKAEEYGGFFITPAPAKEGGRYRVGAIIRKDVDGVEKEHHLIRADTLDSHEDAVGVSLSKAKQVIDEQGDRLFG